MKTIIVIISCVISGCAVNSGREPLITQYSNWDPVKTRQFGNGPAASSGDTKSIIIVNQR